MRVRDALCCQPCGLSPMPLSVTGAGGRHPRLLARMDSPASLQHEGHRLPPLRCGGTSQSHSFPLLPVGGRMPRQCISPCRTIRSGRGTDGAGWAQTAKRCRESRQGPCAVRLARRDSAEAGLQGLPHGVVVGLCVAGYIQRQHCAQRVVGPRRCAHSEKKPRALQVWEAKQLAQKFPLSAHPAYRP